MPSPSFHFAAQAALLKYSAAAGGAVVATLDDLAGVRSVTWAVVSTDETDTVAARQATISLSGTLNSVCTLTAGAAGTAGILRCTVNSGVNDVTGAADPTYSATAKFYVLATNGREVCAVNEQMEADATFGWTSVLNPALRAFGGGLSTAGAGLTEAPAGTVNVVAAAGGCIIVNANDIEADKSAVGGASKLAQYDAGGGLTAAFYRPITGPVAASGIVRLAALDAIKGLIGAGTVSMIATGATDVEVGDASVGLVALGTFLSVGATPATVGTVRLPALATIVGYSAVADRAMLALTASTVEVGDAALGVASLGSWLSIGAAVATAGTVRLPYLASIQARNAGGTAYNLISSIAVDQIQIGDDTVANVEAHVATGGVFTWYVNAAAAGALGDGYVGIGTGYATAGAVRLANNTSVQWDSNIVNPGNVVGIGVGADDVVTVGGATNEAGTVLNCKTGGVHSVRVNSTEIVQVNAAGLTFPASMASVTIAYTQDASAAGGATSWYGQKGANGFAGGNFTLGVGPGGVLGTDAPGTFTIDTGDAVATNSGAVNFTRGAGGTWLQMRYASGLAQVSVTGGLQYTITSGNLAFSTQTAGAISFTSREQLSFHARSGGGTSDFYWYGAGQLQRTDLLTNAGAHTYTTTATATSVTVAQTDKSAAIGTGASHGYKAQNATNAGGGTGGDWTASAGNGVTAGGNATLTGGDGLTAGNGGHALVKGGAGPGAGLVGGVALHALPAAWQAMEAGLFVGDATAAPSGNPAAGVFIWSEGGAAKCRGGGGTVTTFGPADPHCPTCGLDFALEWSNDETGDDLAVCVPCLLASVPGAGGVIRSKLNGGSKATRVAKIEAAKARGQAEHAAHVAATKAAKDAERAEAEAKRAAEEAEAAKPLNVARARLAARQEAERLAAEEAGKATRLAEQARAAAGQGMALVDAGDADGVVLLVDAARAWREAGDNGQAVALLELALVVPGLDPALVAEVEAMRDG